MAAPGDTESSKFGPRSVSSPLASATRSVPAGQWRYTLNRYSWEIPRGGSHPGETDMRKVAERELAEEVGVRASEWRLLGPVDVMNGVTDDVQSLFLATACLR